jgi:hypothetical protein
MSPSSAWDMGGGVGQGSARTMISRFGNLVEFACCVSKLLRIPNCSLPSIFSLCNGNDYLIHPLPVSSVCLEADNFFSSSQIHRQIKRETKLPLTTSSPMSTTEHKHPKCSQEGEKELRIYYL